VVAAAPARAQDAEPTPADAQAAGAEPAAPAEPEPAEPDAAGAATAPGAGEASDLAPLDAPPSAFEQYAAQVIDVFPIRVLGAGATVVGFGSFLVSVPLIAPFGRTEAIKNSWEYFVIGPYDYTFVRPLGEL